MPILTIKEKRSKFSLKIPHKILINNNFVGVMQSNPVNIEMPRGRFTVTIQSMIPFISASEELFLDSGDKVSLSFSDREKWWDIVFVIDILLCIAKFFFDKFNVWTTLGLSNYWSIGYTIFTNGYFVIWLIYEWTIRKKYFRIETEKEN